MTFRDAKLEEALLHAAAPFVQSLSNRTSLITLTRVILSEKGDYAIIYMTVMPTEKEKEALEFLRRQRFDLRDFIKKNIRTRMIPRVDFAIDLGEKNRQKIDELSREH